MFLNEEASGRYKQYVVSESSTVDNSNIPPHISQCSQFTISHCGDGDFTSIKEAIERTSTCSNNITFVLKGSDIEYNLSGCRNNKINGNITFVSHAQSATITGKFHSSGGVSFFNVCLNSVCLSCKTRTQRTRNKFSCNPDRVINSLIIGNTRIKTSGIGLELTGNKYDFVLDGSHPFVFQTCGEHRSCNNCGMITKCSDEKCNNMNESAPVYALSSSDMNSFDNDSIEYHNESPQPLVIYGHYSGTTSRTSYCGHRVEAGSVVIHAAYFPVQNDDCYDETSLDRGYISSTVESNHCSYINNGENLIITSGISNVFHDHELMVCTTYNDNRYVITTEIPKFRMCFNQCIIESSSNNSAITIRSNSDIKLLFDAFNTNIISSASSGVPILSFVDETVGNTASALLQLITVTFIGEDGSLPLPLAFNITASNFAIASRQILRRFVSQLAQLFTTSPIGEDL